MKVQNLWNLLALSLNAILEKSSVAAFHLVHADEAMMIFFLELKANEIH